MAIDTTGTNIQTNAVSASRETFFQVNLRWDGISLTNETTRTVDIQIDSRISDPGQGMAEPGAGVVSTCRLTLDNSTQRFSPDNSGGALYADIQSNKMIGTDVQITIGFVDATNGNEALRRFTGTVDSVQSSGPNSPFVVLNCISEAQKVLEHRVSTGLYQDKFVDTIYTDLFDATPTVSRKGGTPSVAGGDQFFDSGFMRVPFAWLEGEDIWRQLQLLAQADGGFFYVAPDGDYHYENIFHLLTDTDQTTSVLSVDLDEDLYQTVSVGYNEIEVYNTVAVSWQPRRAGANTELFKADRVWTVPANTTKTFTARYRMAALSVDAPVAGEDYFAVSAGGVDMSSSVSITYTLYAQSADISIQNTSATYDVEIRPFRITGVPLIGGPSETYEADATDSAIGDPTSGFVKRREMGTHPTTQIQNVFIQTAQQAQVVGDLALDRAKNPRTAPTFSGVPGIPWLELLDRVTVDSTHNGWTAKAFQVVGISETMTAGNSRYEMTLTLMDSDNFFPYSTADYFVINTDAPSAGTSDRLFY